MQVDRERAADSACDIEDIATALRLMVGGDERGVALPRQAVDEDYDVQLRLTETTATTRDDRAALRLAARPWPPRRWRGARGRDGAGAGLVRLDNLVTIASAQTRVAHRPLDRQRGRPARRRRAPATRSADRLEALRQAVGEMNLPAGYTTRVRAAAASSSRRSREFLWAFLLSSIFMYMILASQFESLIHPFTILLSLPLSVPFALLSLWATGNTLNLYSALGILVLFGVVKKNAILQIDHMNKLRERAWRDATAILRAIAIGCGRS